MCDPGVVVGIEDSYGVCETLAEMPPCFKRVFFKWISKFKIEAINHE